MNPKQQQTFRVLSLESRPHIQPTTSAKPSKTMDRPASIPSQIEPLEARIAPAVFATEVA